MDQVKLENSLAQHQCLFSLIKQCCLKVKEIENHEDLKLKNEVTKYVAKLVEEGISHAPLTKKQKKAINKKTIIIEVIKQVYNLAEEELGLVEDQIEYNLDNKIVKHKSLLQKGWKLGKKLLLGSSKK
ncbi:MAG: hypothetical protein RLZZ293_1375 [Pseudomonadota bacterium]|jgi:hypothetical protein